MGTFGNTYHTVIPEALEHWPASLLGLMLPRHLQIIYEINMRFLAQVRRRRGPDAPTQRMSIVEEHGEERVRMANLAIVGSHSVDGGATRPTGRPQRDPLRDSPELEPHKCSH